VCSCCVCFVAEGLERVCKCCVLHACFVFCVLWLGGFNAPRCRPWPLFYYSVLKCELLLPFCKNTHTHTHTPTHLSQKQAARPSKCATTLQSCRRRLRCSCRSGKVAARNGDLAAGAGGKWLSLSPPALCVKSCNVACCCGAVVLSAPQLEAPQCKQDWRTNIVRFA